MRESSDFVNIAIFLGMSISVSSRIPQLLRIVKRKSSDDVSIIHWVLHCISILLWAIYFIYHKSYTPLILTGLILAINTIIIILAIKYRSVKK